MKKINKDEFKKFLSISQVKDLVAELGGEPISINDGVFISKTICHGGDSHKLYYYENSGMFKCYTHCNEAFDIFDLVCRCKNCRGERRPVYDNSGVREWNLGDALQFCANYFNFSPEIDFDERNDLSDWEYFGRIDNQSSSLKKEKIQLPLYETTVLKHLPVMKLEGWEKEGIDLDVMQSNGICFDPKNYGIVIPHYDADDRLIGIRERILIDEEQKYGKYKPAILNGVMYNHPLGFNLYNLNNSKENIRQYRTAIVFEGEKSSLKYASYFKGSDISVAVCGSHITNYQMDLLLEAGAQNIVIAFDKQYHKKGDAEFKQWSKTLQGIKDRYGSKVMISYILDDNKNRLGYKDSPIDKGKNVFQELFNERIYI